MESWALVIGVDAYWTEAASLRGAVRDALRMREWLLAPAGAGVRPENLVLLLAPRPELAVAPELAYAEPTRRGILQALRQLLERSGGRGRRLYVYFAGHGLSSRVHFSHEQALLPADFHPEDTQQSLGLRSLLEHFQATGFEDQFFFIDACRHVPFQGEFRIGEVPRPALMEARQAPVQQFVFHATSPLRRAAELQQPGDERGAFTAALLEGLRGRGRAKVWDPRSPPGAHQYVVRVDRLFDYVKAELVKQRFPVGGAQSPELFQVPQLQSLRGGDRERDHDPILARLSDQAFTHHLRIRVEPEHPPLEGSVLISPPGFPFPVAQRDAGAFPVEFQLPARDYHVVARALEGGESPARPLQPSHHYVELYEDLEVRFEQQPEPLPGPVVEPALGPMRAPLDFVEPQSAPSKRLRGWPVALLVLLVVPLALLLAGVEGVPVVLGAILLAGLVLAALVPVVGWGVRWWERRKAALTVRGWSRAALVEISDGGGRVLAAGAGLARAARLEPGSYRMRLVLPEGRRTEQSIWLEAGEHSERDLWVPHEWEDPFRFEALLELARDSFVGLIPRGADCGIAVLGVSGDGARAEPVELSLAPCDEPARLHSQAEPWQPLEKARGLVSFSRATRPGSHWLQVGLPGAGRFVLSLPAVPGWLTCLVLRAEGGQPRAFLHLFSLRSSNSEKLARWGALTQGFLAEGRWDHARISAEPLEKESGTQPMAGCLVGYLSLRLGELGRLRRIARALGTRFGGLSDSHVLLGEAVWARGRQQEARAAFTRAFECGLPVFAQGAERLLRAAEHFELQHPRRRWLEALLRQRVPGVLWLASTADPASFSS